MIPLVRKDYHPAFVCDAYQAGNTHVVSFDFLL